MRCVRYGADYYPEQWLPEIHRDDRAKMAQLHVNTVTMGVFCWDKLEPVPGTFELDWMEEHINALWAQNISVILATPTSGMPFWLMEEHPQVMRVNQHGRRMKPGMRANFCPNSPDYAFYCDRIVTELAQRFGLHPAIHMWHINNEYEHYCYCPVCRTAFQDWLRKTYGTIDALNKAWGTQFWSHTYRDFSQIEVPTYLSETKEKELAQRDIACFQALDVDYRRFMSHSIAERIAREAEIIRTYSDKPVTNNFTGLFKPFDYVTLSKALDVISWDNYPTRETPAHQTAFVHDLMRSLKKGQPFYVMEQTPNHVLWRDYCPTKRPGEVSMLCWQAVAHGAIGNLFFQWRQSVSGVEKFHGAMIPHSGRLDTRIGRELEQLGADLQRLSCLDQAHTHARAAILWCWEDWWLLECSAIYNNTVTYPQEVLRYYQVLFELGINTDVIFSTERLSDYAFVLAPFAYALSHQQADDIDRYVAAGGVLLTTTMSAIADKHDRVILGGAPGYLKQILGLWVEETDGLRPGEEVMLSFGEESEQYPASGMCDAIRCTTAVPMAKYCSNYYADTPVLTVNRYGGGWAYYVGTCPSADFIRYFLPECLTNAGVAYHDDIPLGIELCTREDAQYQYHFLINHNEREMSVPHLFSGIDLISEQTVHTTVLLPPKGVAIIKEAKHEESN